MGASFSASDTQVPQDSMLVPEKVVDTHSTENLIESPEAKEAAHETLSESSQVSVGSICFKHSIQNISQKAFNIPSENSPLCDNCSKVMFSYITLMQDFLDSLAREINARKDPKSCEKCIDQELEVFDNNYSNVDARPIDGDSSADSLSCKSEPIFESPTEINKCEQQLEIPVKDLSDKKSSKIKECRRLSAKKGDCYPATVKRSTSLGEYLNNPIQQLEFLYNLSSHSLEKAKVQRPQQQTNLKSTLVLKYLSDREETSLQSTNNSKELNRKSSSPRKKVRRPRSLSLKEPPTFDNYSQAVTAERDAISNLRTKDFLQQEQTKCIESKHVFLEDTEMKDFTENGVFTVKSLKDEADGILTALSNITDEAGTVSESSCCTTASEQMSFERNDVKVEAYVTMCRNNAEVLGCLVVGTSLLLSRTSRRLCVLVTDGVSSAFRESLSSVFHEVQLLRSLDTLGTTKLALLEQPDLGISFDKLSVWRLTQFQKCVYLNPDTLVIQNCDELFNHQELSAVPDVGWPDCFNSGVFVFIPSTRTFWKLMEFADKQGTRDSGDQGLLNSFFNSWSSDINNKLSFIYNLTASVSYTYTPAFNRFGHDVKIVQFNGTFKPWHVKFRGPTGEILEVSTIHPTYIQFVKMWINIFRISVLRLFPGSIQSCLLSQTAMCASDVLCFFPPVTESQGSFYLTPPSARMHSVQNKNLQTLTSSPLSGKVRRKSAEIPVPSNKTPEEGTKEHLKIRRQSLQNMHIEQKNQIDLQKINGSGTSFTDENSPSIKMSEFSDCAENPVSTNKTETCSKSINSSDTDIQTIKLNENTLPGAEIGNYQGMKAWEQGQMDYEGSDCSENIIKRLQFLMAK